MFKKNHPHFKKNSTAINKLPLLPQYLHRRNRSSRIILTLFCISQYLSWGHQFLVAEGQDILFKLGIAFFFFKKTTMSTMPRKTNYWNGRILQIQPVQSIMSQLRKLGLHELLKMTNANIKKHKVHGSEECMLSTGMWPMWFQL